MPQALVAVVPPFLSKRVLGWQRLLLIVALLGAGPVLAQPNAVVSRAVVADYDDGSPYVAGIELHTAAELYALLQRAEQLLLDGQLSQSGSPAVTFILHGPEVRILLRQNYLENKPTVDLAASLSAMGVVEIKACETWMTGQIVSVEELQPFVQTVAGGREEVVRLLEKEQYTYF